VVLELDNFSHVPLACWRENRAIGEAWEKSRKVDHPETFFPLPPAVWRIRCCGGVATSPVTLQCRRAFSLRWGGALDRVITVSHVHHCLAFWAKIQFDFLPSYGP
jgi:hypothetical protein